MTNYFCRPHRSRLLLARAAGARLQAVIAQAHIIAQRFGADDDQVQIAHL
ncbi:MAG TPA: hypothetical protein PKW95_05375 [bacterium]|nr:hypothetical protein [bacterium]